MGRAAFGGSHVPHLQRRHGTYYLRVRVPDVLRVRIGLREVRRSLRVHTFAKARMLAPRFAAQVMEVFVLAQARELSRDEVLALVDKHFGVLAAEVDHVYRPETAQIDLEREYDRHIALESIANLREQLTTRSYAGTVLQEVSKALSALGLTEAEVGAGTVDRLSDGIARALIEQDRLFLFRMDEGLLPYSPTDPLFSRKRKAPEVETVHAKPTSLGPTVSEAMHAYLEEGERLWSPKTIKSRRRQLAYLVEHLGPDRPLASVTPADVVSYRDALRRLRHRSKREVGQSFLGKQTDNEEARISGTTVENLFNPCKAFFRWAKGHQGLISTNPAEDVRLPKTKKPKGQKNRRPFTADELRTLFAAPVFTGMRSHTRRFDPGQVVLKDAYYWIPVLGYYTGARLGELVQLHVADIRLDDPIPHLLITEDGSGERGTGEEKMVKSEAGVRRVPIHPDVMALGFADFVRRRLKDKRPAKRLFWQVGYGADGQPSTVFSKWFARLMDKVGLTDPALVFHSFRHTAEDACRNALLPQYVINRVIGHSGKETSDGYGAGISLDVAARVIEEMQLPIRLWSE